MGSAESFGSGFGAAPTPSGVTPSALAAHAPAAQQQAVHRSIDDSLAALDDLEHVPLGEHVARFDEVHRALSEALSTIDRV